MAIYNASINSFVHMIMYTYYLMSSFDGMKKYLHWFKPLITIMQLVQFVLIMGHCIVAILPSCAANGIFFRMQVGNLVILTILFSHFFIINYLRRSRKSFEAAEGQ